MINCYIYFVVEDNMNVTDCLDPDYINAIMFMYSVGIEIECICAYVGMSDREVNEVISAYNECLL